LIVKDKSSKSGSASGARAGASLAAGAIHLLACRVEDWVMEEQLAVVRYRYMADGEK
jgi:hypothetical protein